MGKGARSRIRIAGLSEMCPWRMVRRPAWSADLLIIYWGIYVRDGCWTLVKHSFELEGGDQSFGVGAGLAHFVGIVGR